MSDIWSLNEQRLEVLQDDWPSTVVARVLIVAGGGGGALLNGGGGGGGVIEAESLEFQSGDTITVFVGSGGGYHNLRNVSPNPPVSTGSNGGDSYIIINSLRTITAIGGGKGEWNSVDGTDGGSGGAGGYYFSRQTTGGAALQTSGPDYIGYGSAGGNSTGLQNQPYSSPGGGGAGEPGQSVSPNASPAGRGGDGISTDIRGYTEYFGGGGSGGAGGSSYTTAQTYQAQGGGGGCSTGNVNGVPNTGGGGAADNRPAGSYDATECGNGGSGVVILRLGRQASSYTGNPVVSNLGSDFVYTFNAAGTITL